MDGARSIMWFVKNDIIMSHVTGKDWQNKQSALVKKSDPNTPEWTKITICNCKRDLQRFVSCFSFAVNTPVVYLHAVGCRNRSYLIYIFLHNSVFGETTQQNVMGIYSRVSWHILDKCHVFTTSFCKNTFCRVCLINEGSRTEETIFQITVVIFKSQGGI